MSQRPTVARVADALIGWRRALLLLFVALTLGFGFSATRLRLDPAFNKMIPLGHEYMQTFQQYAATFTGANRIVLNLRWKGEGDIYNAEFMAALRRATDEVFFIPGVDRTKVTSIFAPSVRFTEVTEKGFFGDVVVPAKFAGTPADLEIVRQNVVRAGEIGSLVARDLKGALVRADLQEIDPTTGQRVSYAEIAARLEAVRSKIGNERIDVDIVGFAKVVGDVIDGLGGVIGFFAVAFAVTALLLLVYTRSPKLTAIALAVALLPVVWLLGLLPLIGFGIDPMSILVPFLIFSIGVSHAVQMTNAWKQAVLRGKDSRAAAHEAFCALFVPGAVALLTNALGFAVILRIDIPIVRELGITACLGVSLMIATNKLLLPIVLSHLKLERRAGRRSTLDGVGRHPLWWRLSRFAERRTGIAVLAAAVLLVAVGTWQSRFLHTGDIGNGAPELREQSRYNQDSRRIVEGYNVGVDVLTVIVETQGFAGDACLHPPVMQAMDRLDLFLRGVAGVRSVASVPSAARVLVTANNEGHPRWGALPATPDALSQGAEAFNPDRGMATDQCKAIQLMVFTENHEGPTIAHVVSEIKRFVAEHPTPGVRFRLAGGNVGVMAATNEAVERAEIAMLASIFGAIALLCLATFRSWTAVLCIIVPLTIVSILCNALMAMLGIGLKVATLPVIALGVGVGVDYGIYLFERIQHELHAGRDLRHAFYEAMRQRGTAAVFTAITMSVGVGTWAFSALKFQADMGVLLAFMFLVNAFGAIVLLPAMAAWFCPPARG